MERIQDALRGILETHLSGQLEAREAMANRPVLVLPAPRKYLLNFDEGFTTIGAGDYPAVIVLPGRTRVEYACTGPILDYIHEVALVCVIHDNNADTLQRRRARYAEAMIEAVLDNFKTTPPIVSARITSVAYDRTLRDEALSAYLSSVWLVMEVRERVAY